MRRSRIRLGQDKKKNPRKSVDFISFYGISEII